VPSQEGVGLGLPDRDFNASDPKPATLVHDQSGGFPIGRLFIKSQLRQA